MGKFRWKGWLTRRNIVSFLAGLVPAGGLGGWAILSLESNREETPQGLRSAEVFTEDELALLEVLFRVMLPSSVATLELRRWALRFDRWVAGYDSSAQRDHSLIRPTRGNVDFSMEATPLSTYREQLASFDTDERLEVGDPSCEEKVRECIRRALDHPVTETTVRWDRQTVPGVVPRSPQGRSLVLDLLSFYYRSREAHDRLYGREIRRYECRGLGSVEQPPTEVA